MIDPIQTAQSALSELIESQNALRAHVATLTEYLESASAEIVDRDLKLARVQAERDHANDLLIGYRETVANLERQLSLCQEHVDNVGFYRECLDRIPLWVQHVFGVDHRFHPDHDPLPPSAS